MQEQKDTQNLQEQQPAATLLNTMPATPTTTQQQSTTTPTSTSTSRHYVDKARLIQLVHDNPILWDCRLPNYKRADKSKTEQWKQLGIIFNVSGERVQRTFTSLREIFRRELNNEKLLGRRFKSKWEFYRSMSFLRDVIRERKPRERHAAKAKRRNQLSPSLNNTLSSSNGIDEYQYFASNDPNIPSIQQQQQQQHQQQQQQPANNNVQQLANSDVQPNSSQISVLNLLTQLSNGGNVVVANNNQNNATAVQTAYQQQQQQQQEQQSTIKNINTSGAGNDDDDDVNLVQPSPATSTTPSMYIKDEIEIPDDDDDDEVDEEDSTSITFDGEVLFRNNNKIKIPMTNVDNNREEQRSKSKRNYKHQLQQWKRSSSSNKPYHEDIDDINEDDGSSIDSVPNKNMLNNATNGNGNELKTQLDLANINEQMSSVSGANGIGGSGICGASGTTGTALFGSRIGESEIKYRRHLVYTKFADFIVAKMDAMNEREADDLMDRMMLVIAQKH